MKKLIFMGEEYEENDVIFEDLERDYLVKDLVYIFSSTKAVTLEEILEDRERTAEFIQFLTDSIKPDNN